METDEETQNALWGHNIFHKQVEEACLTHVVDRLPYRRSFVLNINTRVFSKGSPYFFGENIR